MKKGEKLKVEKPKQYQQGWTEFYKLKFFLTPDTLIPRPETELLIDEIIKIATSTMSPRNDAPFTVLDIGTGSGNIAISVLKNLPQAKVVAIDVSKHALEIAKLNAKLHKVDDRLIFVESDLLEFAGDKAKAPDVIVTNLPYVPTARLMHIDPMVTEWEPKVALDGGIDGFQLYRKLFEQIEQKKLYPKYLIGEIDYSQGDFVLEETKRLFPNAKVQVKNDLAGKQRYFIIKF